MKNELRNKLKFNIPSRLCAPIKSALTLAFILALSLSLSGCKDKAGDVILEKYTQGNASQESNSKEIKTDSAQEATSKDEKGSTNGSRSDGVDVDLTQMSSTMVFSEVYAMITQPDKYQGKTVRMKGKFVIYSPGNPDGSINKDVKFFACVVEDATACCAQGFQFVLPEGKVYPDDYPQINEEITVTGRFEKFKYKVTDMVHLVDATIEQ